jgi:hypothetical protein
VNTARQVESKTAVGPHNVNPLFMGQYRIIEMHFGKAGAGAQDRIFKAGLSDHGLETESPSHLKTVVIHATKKEQRG